MDRKEWYSTDTSGGQALVIEEGTGRNVAVAYEAADAPLLAEAPAMLAALRDLIPLAQEEAQAMRDMQSSEGEEAAANSAWHKLESARAILSRIDGAPTAQPAAPSGEAAPVQTFTAFCQEADGTGTIWIQQVKAETIAEAIAAARRDCAENWGFDVEQVHCLGLAQGDCRIVHWQDLCDGEEG